MWEALKCTIYNWASANNDVTYTKYKDTHHIVNPLITIVLTYRQFSITMEVYVNLEYRECKTKRSNIYTIL